ncbi:unnamed protein product [Paramecium sonneborni]|uniref:Uncharacterized protein n=1 Tax=Paramecium sonneborni TaxID=65129 RepID=A0A8S1RN58_9CILI|nr:unnamed protein product [Paramecium sonneborni]
MLQQLILKTENETTKQAFQYLFHGSFHFSIYPPSPTLNKYQQDKN